MEQRKRIERLAQHFAFFYISVIYMEIVLKAKTVGSVFDTGLLFTVLLSIPLCLLFVFFSSLWGIRGNQIASSILLGAITLYYMIQIVYFTIFDTFMALYSMSGAVKVMEFWRTGISGISESLLPLILLVIPFVLWVIFGRRLCLKGHLGLRGALVIVSVVMLLQTGIAQVVMADNSGVMSRSYLYSKTFVPDLSVQNFGLLTTARLDAKNLLFGTGQSVAAATGEFGETGGDEGETFYEDQVMDIDFESLMASAPSDTVKEMHQYFSAVTPTKKNEYSGMFEGKNLIWICAEGFSSWALDETKTPTLSKMSQEGFVFQNFYNPIWGVSTSDGEYTTCTSLIPKTGVWSFYRSGSNAMPFCLGNQLGAMGYSTRAYHNHTYDYYRRDVSHPNMGYDYKGYGNGLNVTKTWPESDVEMMELTIPEYINDAKFHTYYMTVSGHLEYNFSGNRMAAKHQEDVADLDYSEAARAYIACQMEFDQAVQYLIEQLDAAGILDDTVIVISGDHYPYGLEKSEIDELAGETVEENFELYHSTLIIWNSAMEEPVEINKPCCSLDILPTLSNLFGVEYDSRLLMGRDILSDSEGLVVFSDHSWLTEKGRYNASADEFIPADGEEVDASYAQNMMTKVNAMFDYSAKILDENYYAYVIPEADSSKEMSQ